MMRTDATSAGVTSMVTEAVNPSTLPVIVTGPPGRRPKMSPVGPTSTMEESLDCQLIVRPVRMVLLASRNVATTVMVSLVLIPCRATAMLMEVTTGSVTVTVIEAVLPELVAEIVVTPGATIVTSPVALTVATATAELA